MFSPKDRHNTILYIFIFLSFSLLVFSKAWVIVLIPIAYTSCRCLHP